MKSITTFLMFDTEAEEAVHFYTSVFPDSKILGTTRFTDEELHELEKLPQDQRPGREGKIKTIRFELNGQKFVAGNGGGFFRFSHGVSIQVTCETQSELDRVWTALAKGGHVEECGWLTDRFGVPWQITPSKLDAWINDPDEKRAANVARAVHRMKKLDFAALEKAYLTGELPPNENEDMAYSEHPEATDRLVLH